MFLFLKLKNLIFLRFCELGPIRMAKLHTRFHDYIRSGVYNAGFLIGVAGTIITIFSTQVFQFA
jgi:hypothetical protein